MPSICLCLTFYKDKSPQRAVQMENSANDWLLCRLFSKLKKHCQNATFPTKDGRQLSTIQPTLPETLDHGCMFDMWLLITCTSTSEKISPLSCHPAITLNLGLQKLGAIQFPSKFQTYCTLAKVHHLYFISYSNYLKPTTEVLSAQKPRSQQPTSNPKIFVLTCSWRWCSHIFPW